MLIKWWMQGPAIERTVGEMLWIEANTWGSLISVHKMNQSCLQECFIRLWSFKNTFHTGLLRARCLGLFLMHIPKMSPGGCAWSARVFGWILCVKWNSLECQDPAEYHTVARWSMLVMSRDCFNVYILKPSISWSQPGFVPKLKRHWSFP